MPDSAALDRLAAKVGIEDGWWDFFGTWREVPRETKRAFLIAMGFAISTPEETEQSLEAYELAPWRHRLEPVVVWREDKGKPAIHVVVAEDKVHESVRWALIEEGGKLRSGSFSPNDLPLEEERQLDGRTHRRFLFTLPNEVPSGYHVFRVEGGGRTSETSLIVVPTKAYLQDALKHGHRLWGVSGQVYSLRGREDWGIGDFGSLARLCDRVGEAGAGMVGINPLHALFPAEPDRYSPYSPASRQFLSVAYIDIEAIPEYAVCEAARRIAESEEFKSKLAALRKEKRVDYPAVLALKMPVLEALHDYFHHNYLGRRPNARGEAFHRFQDEGGIALEYFSTFCALQEFFSAEGPHFNYWRNWPEAYRNPHSGEVARFVRQHHRRIEFFEYLQWIADGQLADAAIHCQVRGMAVGLYRDLAVGAPDDSAEIWSTQELTAQGVGIGAPPDPLNHKGQDWGLTPFNPVTLRAAAYRPFIEVLRANMRHAGAMRLDHAMSLLRLYWVPRGAAADQGAYVRYPVDEMFGLVALESLRNKCAIIGEDLGTVPDGFRERMREAEFFAYRLLIFARRPDGEFQSPGEYEEHALVAVGTHDMPPLLGFWEGGDLLHRERLQLYPRPEMVEEERNAREADRGRLVRALAAEGLLPGDFPNSPHLNSHQEEELLAAAHRFLARTPCKLMMVQLEDVVGQKDQMNLPGTVNEHANWQMRYPYVVEKLSALHRFSDIAVILGHVRKSVS
jgi:4-alpha-glucanotransferase